MEALLRQFISVVRGIWRRRWIGLAAAWVVALVGMAALMRLPDRFEATARVYVDTQSVLKPLMDGLAVQPDINQQVAMLARTLITRPNIERLIREADLTILVNSDKERERLIDRLLRDIRLTGSGTENLYILSYRDVDQQRAQRVVQALTAMFVETGLSGKRRDAEAARRFIDDQIKQYEKARGS